MKTKNRHNTVLAVDIDDTIATGRFWVEGEAQPIQENLDYAWLIEHGAFFHALEMGKLAAEVYIDDKALNIDDIDNLTNQ